MPGLEAALDDPDVSEIMINGPGNVWIEGTWAAAADRRATVERGGAGAGRDPYRRPWALDPATTPILDARLDDAARGDLCPAGESGTSRSPCGALGSDRVLGRAACRTRRAPRRTSMHQADTAAPHPPEHPRVRRDRQRQDDAAQRAHRSCFPTTGGSWPSRTRLELRIDSPNCVRFEARGVQQGAVSIRDLVRHALRHRPDHIVVGEVRGGEAADLLQALNTGHGGSLTTVHANNAESALSRLASCAMQGGDDLPWDVTCRGVVDGIAMVIHMTRREGRRVVEEAAVVNGYDAGTNQWDIQRLDRVPV